MHTLFCEKEHEEDMMKYETTEKCLFYLEQSIDLTWELEAHQEWLKQAHMLVKISGPMDSTDVLKDLIKVYNIAKQFKKINVKLLEFLKILIT